MICDTTSPPSQGAVSRARPVGSTEGLLLLPADLPWTGPGPQDPPSPSGGAKTPDGDLTKRAGLDRLQPARSAAPGSAHGSPGLGPPEGRGLRAQGRRLRDPQGCPAHPAAVPQSCGHTPSPAPLTLWLYHQPCGRTPSPAAVSPVTLCLSPQPCPAHLVPVPLAQPCPAHPTAIHPMPVPPAPLTRRRRRSRRPF